MKIKMICLDPDCENEYETEVLNLMGTERIMSPYCYECRAKKRKELDELERKEILRQELDQYNLWMKQSGIPIRYHGKGFDHIEDKPKSNIIKITELCREYADQFPMLRQIDYYSIALYSDKVWGVGKTHLACAIAQKLMNRWNKMSKCPVYYTTESNLFHRIRSTFDHKGNESENDIYNQITTVPLLLIDDVGKEEVSDPRFVQRVWFHMINERYNNMLPVVLTANLNEDGLAKHLGGNRGNEAVYDRLQEMLKNGIYEVTGTSYRKEK